MPSTASQITAFVCLAFSGLLLPANGQDESVWIARIGGAATGTSDEGTVLFLPATGFEVESFRFSNSWGIAAAVERVWRDRWHVGIHASYAPTDFSVSVEESGGTTAQAVDRTTFAPVLLELKYGFLPGRRINPLLGLTGGILFARDASLAIAGGAPTQFAFEEKATYGYMLGADVSLGSGWQLDFTVRSLGFEYAVAENELVPAQTLLDQDFLSAFTHLVMGIGHRW
jgi:hypothetical protein